MEIELVEDDTLPQLNGTILKDDGTPEDITTGWTISLIIDYTTPLVKAATIPLGTDGVFEFPWEEGDLSPGRFRADVKIVSPLGTETFQRTQDDDELYLLVATKIA